MVKEITLQIREKTKPVSCITQYISQRTFYRLIHLPWLAFLPADAREHWVLIHKCAFIFIQLSMSSCFCTKSCRFFSVVALPLQRSLEINYVKYIRILCIFFLWWNSSDFTSPLQFIDVIFLNVKLNDEATFSTLDYFP